MVHWPTTGAHQRGGWFDVTFTKYNNIYNWMLRDEVWIVIAMMY